MSDQEALDSFLDKWRARWPEWAVAQVFVPHAQRTTALAWAALLQELTDAAWGGSDPRPGEAKLAWWQEELQGWSRGIRRHPLGAALVGTRRADQDATGSAAARLDPPYERLSAALPALRVSRERPGDRAEAFATLESFANAVAAIEAVLFDHHAPMPPAPLITATLLHARLAYASDAGAGVPLSVLARAGEGEALAAWRDELATQWPQDRGAPRPRRIWAALARARLQRGDAARPLPTWIALWTAWRAARAG